MKKGISLVALIITIIVLIILTGTVIITINNGNIIGKSNEAVFKSDLTNYRDEFIRVVLDKQSKMEIMGKSEVGKESFITGDGLEIWIPSITDKYKDKLSILEGNLYYIGEDQNEIIWASEINMYPMPTQESPLSTKEVGAYLSFTPDSGEGWYYCDVEGAVKNRYFERSTTAVRWRILEKTEEVVTIVKETPIIPRRDNDVYEGGVLVEGLSLSGQDGYINGPSIMQEISSLYSNSRLGIYPQPIDDVTIETLEGFEREPVIDYNGNQYFGDYCEHEPCFTNEILTNIVNESGNNFWVLPLYSRIRDNEWYTGFPLLAAYNTGYIVYGGFPMYLIDKETGQSEDYISTAGVLPIAVMGSASTIMVKGGQGTREDPYVLD